MDDETATLKSLEGIMQKESQYHSIDCKFACKWSVSRGQLEFFSTTLKMIQVRIHCIKLPHCYTLSYTELPKNNKARFSKIHYLQLYITFIIYFSNRKIIPWSLVMTCKLLIQMKGKQWNQSVTQASIRKSEGSQITQTGKQITKHFNMH